MLWQSDLVDLGFLLEVFREDDLINSSSVVLLPLQTLLDNHVEVFGHTLWYWVVSFFLNFLLQFIDVVGVVRVLVGAHFVENDTESPDIRCLRLRFVEPELRS